MIKITSVLLASALALFTLTACGGGGSKSSTSSTVEARTTTTGQELMDLQKAYNEGVITEREFNNQKKKILESN